jgi:hypothetical protein
MPVHTRPQPTREPKVAVGFRLELSLAEEVSRRARIEDRTISQVLRRLVAERLRQDEGDGR